MPEIILAKEYKVTTEESKAVLLEMARISQENYEVLTPFGIDELRYSPLTTDKIIGCHRLLAKFRCQLERNDVVLKTWDKKKAEKLWINYVQQKPVMIKEGCITKELQETQLNPNIHYDDIIRLQEHYEWLDSQD